MGPPARNCIQGCIYRIRVTFCWKGRRPSDWCYASLAFFISATYYEDKKTPQVVRIFRLRQLSFDPISLKDSKSENWWTISCSCMWEAGDFNDSPFSVNVTYSCRDVWRILRAAWQWYTYLINTTSKWKLVRANNMQHAQCVSAPQRARTHVPV